MNALVTQEYVIKYEADHILMENDPNRWVGFTSNDDVLFTTEDDNYTLVEYDEADKPADFVPEKYKYIDGEFVVNPDYGKGDQSVNTKLAEMDAKFTDGYNKVSDDIKQTNDTVNAINSDLQGRIAEEEEALCDLDKTDSTRLNDIEEALCELAELIENQ